MDNVRIGILLLAALASFPAAQSDLPASLGCWQTAFVENRGQWDIAARYVARAGGLTIGVERDGFVLHALARDHEGSVHSVVKRYRFGEASEALQLSAKVEVAGSRHYLFGEDPSRWHRNVPAFAGILWSDVWDGVDVELSVSEGRPALTLRVSQGCSLDEFSLLDEERRDHLLAADGAVFAPTALGNLRWLQPLARSTASDGAAEVPTASWRSREVGGLSIDVRDREHDAPLVITAGLEWATYFGGTAFDFVQDSAMLTDGRIALTGQTTSIDFPVTGGAFDVTYNWIDDPFGKEDAFVVVLNASGTSLAYATYLGGSKRDEGQHLAAGGDRVTVTGRTFSLNFPTTPDAFNSTFSGTSAETFITQLLPDGSGLIFSGLLGGSSSDTPAGLSMAVDGDVIVAGSTASADFPVTPGALQHTLAGNNDGFVTRLRHDGTVLVWSATFGGSLSDLVRDLTIADNEDIIICGNNGGAADFPFTPGAYQLGGNSPFVLRISHNGSTLLASTAWGGDPIAGGDVSRVVRLDSYGNIVVAGDTTNWQFPTTPGVFQPESSGSFVHDAFVVAFDPTLGQLLYATLLGGAGIEDPSDMAFDSAGGLIVSGTTTSPSFPVTLGAFDTQMNASDVFISRLSPGVERMWYSTYLGGSGGEKHGGMADRVPLLLTPDGGVVVGHYTLSANYPTTPGALFETQPGGGDFALAKLTLLPLGCQRYGEPTPGAHGEPTLGVTAMPRVGSTDFGFLYGAAPPLTRGLLVIGLAALDQPLHAAGVGLWVAPPSMVLLPIASNSIGALEQRFAIPADPALAGFTAFAQAVWKTGDPRHAYVASRALAITVQP